MKMSIFKHASYRRLFLTIAGGLFLLGGALSYMLYTIPEKGMYTQTETHPAQEIIVQAVYPQRITIPSVGIDAHVEQPQSQNVEVLDQALLKGAVYYPGSGTLVGGNVFMFAHSTGLSVVRNQAFKAFNNLKHTQIGDEIQVTGDDGNIYVYSAISTELVSEDTALVEFDTSVRMLTLSTCNTFGAKEERHVVKAVFSYMK